MTKERYEYVDDQSAFRAYLSAPGRIMAAVLVFVVVVAFWAFV